MSPIFLIVENTGMVVCIFCIFLKKPWIGLWAVILAFPVHNDWRFMNLGFLNLFYKSNDISEHEHSCKNLYLEQLLRIRFISTLF